MKINFLKIIIIFFLIIFFGSCSITKNLNENDYVLEKNRVLVNGKTGLTSTWVTLGDQLELLPPILHKIAPKFQGEKMSLVWDGTGKKYNRGKGLMLFKENVLVAKSNKIEKLIYTME